MFGFLSRGGRRPGVVPDVTRRTPNPDREIIVEIEAYLRSMRRAAPGMPPAAFLAVGVAARTAVHGDADRPEG